MVTSGERRRALVIGGSIGGLFVGLLLRRRGWEVAICERSQVPLSGRGAGIVTHPQLWDLLGEVGLGAGREDGVAVEERVTLDRAGHVVGWVARRQVMTSWDRLFGLLRVAWGEDGYRLGCGLRRVTQDGGAVVAAFEDGTTATCDLLVAADGFRSTVRPQVLGAGEPGYAGYVGWRGMVAEAAIPAKGHRDMFGVFGFCLPDGEQFIGYPVAGDGHDLRPGHRRYNFVWYRPAEADGILADLLTDTTGVRHSVSIPPPLIRPALVETMRRDAGRLLAPQFTAIVRATAAPFLQPIYDHDVAAMAVGRVALVGDAAFVARPHVGAGVTKAVADGWALVEALAADADVTSALRAYSAERVPAGRRIVERARHLGAFMQARLASDGERAAAGRHRSVEAVMAETASLDF